MRTGGCWGATTLTVNGYRLSLAAYNASRGETRIQTSLFAPGLSWTDVEVIRDASGCPRLEVRGTVAGAASQRGIRHWHVSLSHDAGMSIAMVVAEG